MAKAMLVAAGTTGLAAGSTRYLFVGTGRILGNATESSHQVAFGVAGTISKLEVNITVNGATSDTVITSRIDGSDGNQVITIGAGATGKFNDLDHVDTFDAGALVNVRAVIGATSAVSFDGLAVLYETSGDASVNIIIAGPGAHASNNTTRYFHPIGDTTVQTAEDDTVFTVRRACTLKNVFVRVASNARTSDTVLTLRKNGADTAITFTYAASETGTKEDTVNTVDLEAGDTFNWESVTGAGTGESFQYTTVKVEIETSDGSIIIGNGDDAGNTQNSNVTTHYAIGGDTSQDVVEERREVTMRYAGTARNMAIRVATNTIATSPIVITLRKNGEDTALSVSIDAGATGLLTNLDDSVSFVEGDVLNYQSITPNTSGSIIYDNMQLELIPAAAVVASTGRRSISHRSILQTQRVSRNLSEIGISA